MLVALSGFIRETKVQGTLTNRHTISFVVDDGVIVLDKADVLRVLPQLQYFADTGMDLDDA
jgi:hypothetical protein